MKPPNNNQSEISPLGGNIIALGFLFLVMFRIDHTGCSREKKNGVDVNAIILYTALVKSHLILLLQINIKHK